MENRKVGFLFLGIAILVIVIIFLFNNAMKQIVLGSCGLAHGPVCEMNKTIKEQTYLSLAIVGILILFAIFLIFSKPKEKIVVRKIKEIQKKKNYDLSELRKEDREVFKIIREQGAIFQAELIEKTGYGKVKITRIIDTLEAKGFVERKRRGMMNVVVLK